MKIDGLNNINNTNNTHKLPEIKNIEVEELNSPQVKDMDRDIDVRYEKLSLDDKPHMYDLKSVKTLSKGLEDLYGQVVKAVEDTLTEQVKTDEALRLMDGKKLDKSALAEARQLISPEGRLGVELVSKNIVDLIKAASSGEQGKIDALIEAIDKVFKELEDSLGQLPQISKKTYDSIIEKLDNFVSIGRFENQPEKAEVLLKEIVKDMIVNQAKTEELLGQLDLVDGKGSKLNEAKELIIPKDLVDREGLGEKAFEEIVTSQTKVLELLKQIDRVRVSDTRVTGLKELLTSEGKVEMEQALIAEVKDLISQEGRLGLETMSKKIVDFAKVLSDGDREKLDSLILVINKSVKETKESLGYLPEVSKKAYDRIVRDLEDWEKELEKRRYPGPAIFAESMNYYRRIKDYSRFGIKTYIVIVAASIILYYILKSFM